jgi:MFS transporter, UMF1 family
MSVLAPVILQNLAAGSAREIADKTLPCNYSMNGYACEVEISRGWYINVNSFPLFVTSLSVGLQAIFFISLGAIADHGGEDAYFMLQD